MANGDPLYVVPALLGSFIVVFGLFSMTIKERLFLSESLVSTVYGIIIGPIALNLVDPGEWRSAPESAAAADADDAFSKLTMMLARVTIAISVMAAGIALPKAYLRREWKSLLMLLVPVMSSMWLLGAGILMMFFRLPFLDALLISGCIAPTDPVLSNSIVKGHFAERYVPTHVRDIISAESGANDGLGFPWVTFALFMLRASRPDDATIADHYSTGHAIAKWFYAVWAYQILLSIVIGVVVGYVARKVVRFAESRDLIDKESFLSFAIALTLAMLGSIALMGSDDILAIFIAGNSFTWDDWFRIETKDAHLQEVFDMLFNTTFFVYFGTTIPWHAFTDAARGLSAGKLAAAAALMLTVRRLPIVMLLQKLTPALRNSREALFAGFFGPIGAGAVFYEMIAFEEMHKEGPRDHHGAYGFLHPVVSFMVLSSILVHGFTVPLFLLGKSGVRKVRTRTLQNERIARMLPRLRPGQQIVIRRKEEADSEKMEQAEDGGGIEVNIDDEAQAESALPSDTISTPVQTPGYQALDRTFTCDTHAGSETAAASEAGEQPNSSSTSPSVTINVVPVSQPNIHN
ncbi:hypothetical protein GQ42DRAFT_55122 [Ramicandelaber brevisporus]|nr:hypothetical protein GQ42DRAFT_55122 [Ramicandelaber brevisporus]